MKQVLDGVPVEFFLYLVFVLSGIAAVLLILRVVYQWGKGQRNSRSFELKSLPSSTKLKKR